MNKGRSRLRTSLALCVIIGLAAVGVANAKLFGRSKSVSKKTAVVRKTLLVFPFDAGDPSRVPEGFGDYVASDLRTMLSSGSDYAVYLYRDRLSSIVRAKDDNTLNSKDIIPPFAEDRGEKALKLGRVIASDYVLIGAIDDCNVDAKGKSAMVTLSAELIDVKTGRVVKALSVTGRSPESAKTQFEDELRDIAKGDAVTKLMAEIVAQPKTDSGGAEAAPSEAKEPAAKQNTSPATQPEKKAPA